VSALDGCHASEPMGAKCLWCFGARGGMHVDLA
jgi:hypothetical protein